MEAIFHWITQYGYIGIFSLLVLGIVGLPVPDETLLTFAGYLVSQGRLQIVPTVGSACAGSICGITLSYIVGRATGYFVIERYGPKLHIRMEHVHRVHHWFRRIGGFTLTFGYFIPGVRHLTAYVAGASELEAPRFAAFAYPGALLWSTSFIVLGYFLGEKWEEASGHVHKLVFLAVGTVLLAAAGVYVWHRAKKR